MSEFGGPDILGPSEGGSSAPEQLSEEAKQRFAAAAAAMQQIQREEKRSKKRDDQVAKAIVQFLGQDEHTHLFLLISRLVARDCPSIFILTILSLIHDAAEQAVIDYMKNNGVVLNLEEEETSVQLTNSNLPAEMNRELLEWISHMQLIVSMDAKNILSHLLIDDQNIDGTVLQLTTFVLSEFFGQHGRKIMFDQLQPLTANILQNVFEPFLHHIVKLEEPMEEN